MEQPQKLKNPSSPSYKHPPSLHYLSELGLDYEWQNAWLESGNMFPFESHDCFLDTFIASGEISSTDKQAAKIEKRRIFPHINIPVSANDMADSRPYATGRLQPRPKSISSTTSSIRSCCGSDSPLDRPLLLPHATRQAEMQSALSLNSSPAHIYHTGDTLASPTTRRSTGGQITTPPLPLTKKRKSIQAICEAMKSLLSLPDDFSKLDTLNHVLELIEQGRVVFD